MASEFYFAVLLWHSYILCLLDQPDGWVTLSYRRREAYDAYLEQHELYDHDVQVFYAQFNAVIRKEVSHD